jgi:hypothetical protein
MNDLTHPNTRTGKIARLPREVREELNRRLADGEAARRLLEWLNALPTVQAVLAAEFGGRAVNEQNLTAWRQGGFIDWERQEEARGLMRTLVEEDDDLRKATGEVGFAERIATLTLLALARTLRALPPEADLAERQKVVFGVAQQVSRLQRSQAAVERARFAREKGAAQAETEAATRPAHKTSEEKLARIHEIFGVSGLSPRDEEFLQKRAKLYVSQIKAGDAGEEIPVDEAEVEAERFSRLTPLQRMREVFDVRLRDDDQSRRGVDEAKSR